MNGRVMDGLTGRFISPDPYVADANLTQSFNRYAYVNNSPLSFTDPSGFTPWQFEFEGIDISVTIRFGKSKRGRAARVVKGRFVLLADSCYGKANSGIFDVSSDVFGPGYGGYGNYNDFILNTWTTGEVAHEGAIIFWPGYDLGTCIYEGGCSWLDWGFGIIGVIPGGKAATTGAKGLVKGAGKLDDLADLRKVSKTCCFVAGTLVDTEDGLVPIEEIKVGDRVWARDVDSGETALKEVIDLIRRHERRIWVINFEAADGTIHQFETTDDHPWWIPDLGWVNTSELSLGMVAASREGEALIVNEVAETERFAATFNLTVADFETYFVGKLGILVHNCNLDNVSDIPTNADELADLTNAQRRYHILDGDGPGQGGHGPGRNIPNKSEFPDGWTDDQVMHAISDVATDPNSVTRAGRNGRTITEGTRNGVEIRVVQEANGEIVTGFPINVPRNPSQ